jgi:hypothetical protein
MNAQALAVLKRKSSPEFFQSVRFFWRESRFYARLAKWYCGFFAPRAILSLFVKRTPKIESFPSGQVSELEKQLQGINVVAPTAMCRVMTRYGSDKGRGWHNYTTVYSALMGKLRKRPLRILELGLGPLRPGASLRGWQELFPLAPIYGADINRDILITESRIKSFYCDQCDSHAIGELWSQPALREAMDVIVDDGLHTFEGNISFLDLSLGHLKPGGIYIVEDIIREALDSWRDVLETVYPKRFPDYEFALLELPNPVNPYDNNLLIARRRV